MNATPNGVRMHLGLYGRRNAGKSSLLNALVGQQVSLVHPTPGTTTDLVEKPMELKPLGPVLWIDTAGVDDEGELGEKRVARTREAMDRTECALLVTDGGRWEQTEEALHRELVAKKNRVLVVHNKADVCDATRVAAKPGIWVSAATGSGLDALRAEMAKWVPRHGMEERPLLADLVGPGEIAVLVIPIDQEAPQGRLILPQVQAIRDLLDGDALALVVKERELSVALASLAKAPRLVVTDSQAFLKAAADVPRAVPLTSFSILLSRAKGRLPQQVDGARAIDQLRGGDRVLIAEACAHHPIGEDIGRVKIPRWLTQRVGAPLAIEHVQGHDFPEDLSPYRLIVHCGACTLGKAEVRARLDRAAAQGVPMTNYGIAIAQCLGMLERALSPFPDLAKGAP